MITIIRGKKNMATWDLSYTKHHVLICNGSSCNRVGAEELTQAIRKEISNRELDVTIHTTRTRCNGRCQDKCVVIAYPQGTWYKELKPEDAPLLIDSLKNNRDYTGKVSHLYNAEGFERTDGVVVGVSKDKEKVKKVSKIL
jgi:(2Fe-2S) ferredoxin